MSETLYALIDAAGVPTGRTAYFDDAEDAPQLAESKGRWVPLVDGGGMGPLEVVSAGAVSFARRRDLTADELAIHRAAKLGDVKAEAQRRILAILPEYKQRNFMALGIELVTTHGADPAAWPADMKAVYDATMVQWVSIKAIRERSGQIEALVPQDEAGIAAFDVTAGWDA